MLAYNQPVNSRAGRYVVPSYKALKYNIFSLGDASRGTAYNEIGHRFLSKASSATIAVHRSGLALTSPSSLASPWVEITPASGVINYASLWCLAYCNSPSTTNRIALQLAGNAFGQGNFEIYFGNGVTDKIGCRMITSGPVTHTHDSTITPEAGRVYSILVTRSQTDWKIYIDGVDCSTTTSPTANNFRLSLDRLIVAGSISSAASALNGGVLAWAAAYDVIPANVIDEPWALFKSRRIWVPQTSGGTNTYTFSVSGGATFSGTSPLVRERIQTPSGGIAFAGAPVISHERAIQASGQVTFSGSAPIVTTASHQLTPSGGVTFSGSPDVIKEKVIETDGGVSFGGSSRLIFVPVGGVGNNDSDRISVGVSRKIGVS